MIVQRYRQRISGPLLDRIDLCVSLDVPSVDELCAAPGPERGPTHAEWCARVDRARSRMRERQSDQRNFELGGSELERVAPLAGEARSMLARAAQSRGLSARGVQSLRRVARTIADLEDSSALEPKHFAQALGLRASISS